MMLKSMVNMKWHKCINVAPIKNRNYSCDDVNDAKNGTIAASGPLM